MIKEKFELNMKSVVALALAFVVGFAPTAWAVDAHIFRVPSTGAPTGASVSTTGVYEGNGANLTGIVHTTALAHSAITAVGTSDHHVKTVDTSASVNCGAGQYLQGNGSCDTLSTGAHTTTLAHSALTAIGTSDHHVKTTALAHSAITAVGANDHHTPTVDTDTQNVINATPVNGSLTTSVSSDYVFDHNANASAHHTATVDTTDGNAKTLCADNQYLKGQDATTCVSAGTIVSDGGAVTGAHTTTLAHSALTAVGTSDHHVKTVDTNTQNVINATPVNGSLTTSISSDYAFDHDANASAHHVKTTALAHSAITAVGTSDHHVKTVDTNTNADTQCGSGEYLNGTGGCDQANGLLSAYEGKKTQANICLDSPSATGNFMTQSDSPYQVWTASGTAIGQWIGSQNGLGPCL